MYLQVGFSTGLTARVAWKYDKRTTLDASARVSVVGGPSQVEVGARYRWGRLTSTGLSAVYGTQVRPYALPFCPALWSALCPAMLCWPLNAPCSALPSAPQPYPTACPRHSRLAPC